jgi:peptidoglycan hydrolase CwlO-like protein
MTNSPESNRPDRDLRQRVREMDWRIQRLEATQMPAKSIDEAFGQVYDELDELQDKSDAIGSDIAVMKTDIAVMKTDIARLEGKIDIILQHITGLGN